MMRFSRSFRIALVSLLLGVVGAEAQTNTRNQPNMWAAPQTFNSGELILGGSGVASNCAAFNSSSALIGQACPGASTPTDVQIFAPLDKAGAAAVYAAGSGYNTNDTITVATTGGTCSIAPILTVTASGGAITALSVTTVGSCTVIPANNPATQGSTSGSGTGATFVITWVAINQTYTPTSGMKLVRVCALGPGAGGGSGALEAASTAASGGAGGGGGALIAGTFTATQIGASQTITLGVGSNGGTPPTTNTTAGASGTLPSYTFFGTLLKAGEGYEGTGGQLGAVVSTGGAGSGYQPGFQGTGSYGGASGGAGNGGGAPVNTFGGGGGGGTTAAGVAGAGGTASGGGPGGGSAGGLTSSSGTNGGQAGGYNYSNGVGTLPPLNSAANASGGSGTNPSSPTCEAMSGTGGAGGGSAATTTTAGNGGNGGYGAGGGGGGSAVNGSGSIAGWGGRGGDGYTIVIEYF
jgi:hypothetical protein